MIITINGKSYEVCNEKELMDLMIQFGFEYSLPAPIQVIKGKKIVGTTR